MKSSFNTPLLAELITKTDWRLVADFSYYSELLGRLIALPAGFVTDFASVPRLPVAYLLAGGTSIKPAGIHDGLYRMCLLGADGREQSDAVLSEGQEITGEPRWRIVMMHAGVRAFGGQFYCSGKNPAGSGMGNATALQLTARSVNPALIRPVPNSMVPKAMRYPGAMHPTVKELL